MHFWVKGFGLRSVMLLQREYFLCLPYLICCAAFKCTPATVNFPYLSHTSHTLHLSWWKCTLSLLSFILLLKIPVLCFKALPQFLAWWFTYPASKGSLLPLTKFTRVHMIHGFHEKLCKNALFMVDENCWSYLIFYQPHSWEKSCLVSSVCPSL